MPINRQGLLASTVLLSHACGPAAMIRYVPMIGKRTQKPGNALCGLILTNPDASRTMPMVASTLLRISRAGGVAATGMNGNDRPPKVVAEARRPPNRISQARVCGEANAI